MRESSQKTAQGRDLFGILRERWLAGPVCASAALMALTLGLLLYFGVFENLFRLPLHAFPDRSMGVTVLHGVDANSRTLWYCTIIFVVILVIPAAYAILARMEASLAAGCPLTGRSMRTARLNLAMFALFLTLYGLFRGEPHFFDLAWTLAGLTGLSFFNDFTGQYRQMRASASAALQRDPSMPVFAVMFSFTVVMTGWSFFSLSLPFTLPHVIVFFITGFLVVFFYPVLLARAGADPARIKPANLAAAAVWALIPALLPLSNELHYSLSGKPGPNPELFARWITGGVIFAGVLAYSLAFYRKPGWRTSLFTGNLIFPFLVGGFFLVGAVNGVISFKEFDLFHNGERMVVTQQMFSFGRIPFTDIIPTHGVMDFLGQSLYSLVNGYRGPEMFLWRWVPVLAATLLLYFMLARLATPLFAFLFLLLAPELILVHNNYRYCMAIMLVLLWVARKPDLKRYMVLGLSLVLLFFWRYDFGVIATIATLCVVPALRLEKTGEKLSTGNLVGSYRPALAGFAIVFATAVALYALALVASGYNAATILRQFYYYFKIQIPTQTTLVPYDSHSALFFLEYIVTPILSVTYIVYYLMALLRGERFSRIRVAMVWLAVFGVVISMRMIQRHTLDEGFNPVYSIFLACSAPFYFPGVGRKTARVLFLVIFLVYAMLISGGRERVFVRSDHNSHIPDGPLYEFFDLPGKASRVDIQDSSQFRDFRRFCDRYLEPGTTFFDFSNAPILYVFTDRLFPAHLIPNLYQAADPIQEYLVGRLDQYRAGGTMPLVLFRQNSFWDSIDGVPQPVRSYRVAEWIYNRYDPWARVGPYEIWKEKGRRPGVIAGNSHRPAFRPEVIVAGSGIELLHADADSISIRATGYDPHLAGVTDLGDGIPVEPGVECLVKGSYLASRKGWLQVFYSLNGAPFTEKASKFIEVKETGKVQEFSFLLPRASRHGRLTNLRFDPPSGGDFRLYRTEIAGSAWYPVERTDPQHFNLRMLPFIWGNFDAAKASEKTALLADCDVGNPVLNAGEERHVRIGAVGDRSTGNYLHLVIEAADIGWVELSYGGRHPSTFTFDLVPSGGEEHYLVRASCQWAWMHDPIEEVIITPSVPVTLKKFMIRKGD